jgi:hypothetical protein
VRVTAITDREPLEFGTETRIVVIFAQPKYEPIADILETLKVIKLLLRKVEIGYISLIKNRKK